MTQLANYSKFMETQPKLRVEPDNLDRLMDGLAVFCLLLLLLFPIIYFGELPDTIPMHFNGRGEADGFGQKATLWLLPGLGLVLFLAMHFLQDRPEWYNYPVKITPENASRQYRVASRMIRALKVVVMLIFAYLSWGTIQVALGHQATLHPAFLWGTMGLVFGVLGWYIWKAIQKK